MIKVLFENFVLFLMLLIGMYLAGSFFIRLYKKVLKLKTEEKKDE